MNPQTSNPQPDHKPENVGDTNGIPTIDTSTGSVSMQPVATELPQVSTQQHSAPQVSSSGAGMMPGVPGTKRWVLPAIFAGGFVALIAVGYVFGMYLPNRPSAIYAKSLTRSSQAVDALVNYSGDYTKKDYKAFNLNGSVHLKSSSGSVDATVKGDIDKDANASVAVKADVIGEKINIDLRTVHVGSSASPDAYVRVSGIKPLLEGLGAGSMSSLDGQWISVDHTLLDTYAAGLAEQEVNADSMPTDEQLHDALVKVQQVNKQYLFTTNSSKAVLTQSKYVGKETKDGRSVYHYKVGYGKTHLQDYLKAVGVALDSSKLNAWSKSANDGKKISEVMDFNDLVSSVKDAKANYTFDMWVDAETKLVHQLQFADPSDAHTTFSLAQNYTGGDDYPFAITMSAMVNGTSETAAMKINLNKKTDISSGELSITSGATTGTFKFTVTPSNKSVTVVAPSGAMPVMSLLSQLGLSGDASGLTSGLGSLDGLTSL